MDKGRERYNRIGYKNKEREKNEEEQDKEKRGR